MVKELLQADASAIGEATSECSDVSVSESRDITLTEGVAEGVAEGVGFEPTEACTSRLFKSRGFVRSAIPPSASQGSRGTARPEISETVSRGIPRTGL